MRSLADRSAAAVPAPPHAPVRRESQPIGVHLVDAADLRQRVPLGALESDRRQQLAVHQEGEQAFEERAGGVRRHAPTSWRSAACVVWPASLSHWITSVGLLRGLPAQLGADRSAKIRQIPLLNLPIAVHPVFGEDLVLGVVQRAPAAQVVEHARNTFTQALRGDGQRVRVFLDPGQGGVETLVLHLHPAPGFEAQRLPRRQGDLAQHLEAKVLAAFLLVPPAAIRGAPPARLPESAPAKAPRHPPSDRRGKQRDRRSIAGFP